MNTPGRPKKPAGDKKQPVCIKLSPWVKAKLKEVNASQTVENALVNFWRKDMYTIEITKYNKDRNEFIAELNNNTEVRFDPFVTGALQFSEDDYENNKGFEFVGKSYHMSSYSTYLGCIIPDTSGLIEIN
jgi:hypothetical protein